MSEMWIGLLVPLFAISGAVAIVWTVSQARLRRRQLDHEAKMRGAAMPEHVAKLERLEQRVQVLERIMTDRSTTLADEIERLRNAPLN